jgi:hypothetical protein
VLTIATLALAAAAATPTPSLVSTAPWWEKVTVTVSGDGKPRACRYESSQPSSDPGACDVSGSASAIGASSSGSKEEVTRITFERQFIPGGTQPGEAKMEIGDTLLGRQVMALAIDSAGAVKGCRVVEKSGDMTPDYGCDEARAEMFEASAGKSAAPHRQGYMTIMVYGHAEHVA